MITDQFTAFKAFMEKISQIPLSDWPFILSNVELKQLKKGEFLFCQDQDFTKLGLVKTGLIYTYFLDQSGHKAVKNFAWEGRLIAPLASLISNKKAWFTAEALEPTNVYLIDYAKALELTKKSHSWAMLFLKSVQMTLAEREKREYDMLMLSLLERYDVFCEYYSPIQERITQEIIASYLGVSPVSLSRALAGRKS